MDRRFRFDSQAVIGNPSIVLPPSPSIVSSPCVVSNEHPLYRMSPHSLPLRTQASDAGSSTTPQAPFEHHLAFCSASLHDGLVPQHVRHRSHTRLPLPFLPSSFPISHPPLYPAFFIYNFNSKFFFSERFFFFFFFFPFHFLFILKHFTGKNNKETYPHLTNAFPPRFVSSCSSLSNSTAWSTAPPTSTSTMRGGWITVPAPCCTATWRRG